MPAWVPLDGGPPAQRGFVPLDEIVPVVVVPVAAPVIAYVEALEAPTSLFGDAER